MIISYKYIIKEDAIIEYKEDKQSDNKSIK